MKRRHILAQTVAASIVSSGCMMKSKDNQDPQVGLGRMTMRNLREETIDVHLLIEKGEEIAYDKTHQLDAKENTTVSSLEIREDWMGEKTPYNVIVSIDGTDQKNSFSTEDATEFVSNWGDNECYMLSASLEESGIYFAMGTMESCTEELDFD